METRSLSEVYGSQGTQQQGQSSNDMTLYSRNYNTYLTIFSINTVYRFPDVSDLTTIPVQNVSSVSDFALACSRIALETWDRNYSQGFTRQRDLSRQSRAA